MRHSGDRACGIPDGESIVMTGGWGHSFVTRSLVNDAGVTFINTTWSKMSQKSQMLSYYCSFVTKDRMTENMDNVEI